MCFFPPHLFPAPVTSDPCDVPWCVFGLFYQSLQLLGVAQQRVGQLLQVQPGVLLGFAHHGARPSDGPHLQAGHEPVGRRRHPGHLGMNRLRRDGERWQRRQHCGREGTRVSAEARTLKSPSPGSVRIRPELRPAVLVNTSFWAEPSEIMAAAVVVGSPGVRSKVKVPEVVNCPDGDTVTVEGQRTF